MYAVQSIERKKIMAQNYQDIHAHDKSIKTSDYNCIHILNALHLFWTDVAEYTASVSFNVDGKVRRLQCIIA